MNVVTSKDLEGLPYNVRNDKTVQARLKAGSVRAGETKEQSDALDKSVTRLTNEITNYNDATGVKGVDMTMLNEESVGH